MCAGVVNYNGRIYKYLFLLVPCISPGLECHISTSGTQELLIESRKRVQGGLGSGESCGLGGMGTLVWARAKQATFYVLGTQ